MAVTQPYHLEEISLEELIAPAFKLILHNDDFHTFDYVIEALVEKCQHSYEQAEQCAHIVHYKGQCDVKRGSMEVIERSHRFLAEKGLIVSIE